MSRNLQLCLKEQFQGDVFLGNLRNFSNRYSQKLHILLSFFITYFANFIYSSPNLWNQIHAEAYFPSSRSKMFLVKIVKDCESRGIFRTQQNIKMELFAEKVNGFQPFIIFVKSAILDVLNTFWILNTVLNTSLEALTTFARSFILDVWLGFRYVSDVK